MTRTRILAALVMAPIAIAAILLLNTPWLALLAAVLFMGGMWEWYRLADVEDTLARLVLITANLLLMVALVWAGHTGNGGSLVLLQVAVVIGVGWWLLAALWLRHYDFGADHESHARIFKLAAATLAIIPAWAALALVHAGDPEPSRIPGVQQGHVWLLCALMTVWAADSGAYFAGRHLGKHKLSPRISPNKTVEGLFGGIAAGMLVALAMAWLAGTSGWGLLQVAVLALVTVVFSVVGDLYESLIKRHAGAKDSGDLIPGHGGVLDRIDAVLAALPVFALGKSLLGL
ncbi:MAG: phosphatidate cytidylyltransferase [Pseudoxanthomonas suwonensis]|nr:phosphatidate cytidylyltransferase [Pseudoxanthomonas suwonensis]